MKGAVEEEGAETQFSKEKLKMCLDRMAEGELQTATLLVEGSQINVKVIINWLVIHASAALRKLEEPVPLILECPKCGERHIDPPSMRPHKTHACQNCGFNWAPASQPTIGVEFLPGCKNEEAPKDDQA